MWTKNWTQERINEGFVALGLEQRVRDAYPGAQRFGAQFKKCTILENVPTTYSASTSVKQK